MPFYRTGARPYINNVSNLPGNAANTINCPAGVDTIMKMSGDGANNKLSRTIASGYCDFDPTYNTSKGGILTRRCTPDTQFFVRVTVVNIDTPTNAVVKCFIVFTDTTSGGPGGSPLTGTFISSSSKRFIQGEEGTAILKFFGGGVLACYPVVNSELTRDFRLNGFQVFAGEALRPA